MTELGSRGGDLSDILKLLKSSGLIGKSEKDLVLNFLNSSLPAINSSGRKNYFFVKPSSFLALDLDYYNGLSLKSLAELGYLTSKLRFRCPYCGYKYMFTASEISNKKTKYGCACCTGRVVVAGINDLASNDRHNLLLDWDYKKNVIKPTEVTYMSSKLVNWKCHTCGYSWKKDVSTRNNKNSPRGCPVCSNQLVISGTNDFATKNKDYMHLWGYSKNTLDPTKITPSNSRVVYMVCELGHSFSAKCNNLTTKLQSGHIPCPYCERKKLKSGLNDAATLYPFIIDKWDYSKNSISPYDLQPFSNNLVWWTCEKNHSWQTSIGYMCREDTGCPVCWSEKGISNLEKDILSYIESLLPEEELVTKRKVYNNFFAKEVDIVIESRKLGLEVNGVYYHSTQVRKEPLYHKNKSEDVRKHLGLSLFYLWEDDWLDAREESKVLLDFYVNGTKERVPHFQEISYSTAKRIAKSMVGVLPQGSSYYLGKTKRYSLLFAVRDGIIVYSSNIFLLLNSLDFLNTSITSLVIPDGLQGRLLSYTRKMRLIRGDLVDKSSVLNNKRTDEVDTGIYCYSDGISIWRFK